MKTKEAKAAKQATIDRLAEYVTINKQGRQALFEQFGLGPNDFNAYVGKRNIHVPTLTLAQTNSEAFRLAMIDAPSELAFYTTQGEGGLHGGKCELFTFDYEGKTLRAVRHPFTGAFVLDGMIRGMRIVTGDELIALAAKVRDLRQFSVTWFSKETAASNGIKAKAGDSTVYAGALIGDMNEKRQVLVHNDGDGLKAVCLTTGKIGKCEKADRAVEIGALSDADKLTIAETLFAGVRRERQKSHARNTARALRKAARGASK